MNRKIISGAAFALLTPIFVASVAAQGEAEAQGTVLQLRPLPLAEGIRDVLNPGGDPKKLGERSVYKLAKRAGVDLAEPQPDPVVAIHRSPSRLFYVFYKTGEEAFAGGKVYLIQRIKRTERNWKTPDSEPEVEVTYQTECFKLLSGAQKRADQHHGSYGMGEWYRREVVKEYELGFGEVPGLCEGDAWPFESRILFKYLERYGKGHEIYDQVRFDRSVHWTLTVSLSGDGGYVVRAPELGIDLPKRPTDAALCVPAKDPASEELVLERHVGLRGAQQGADLFASLQQLAGKVLEDVPAGRSNRNVSFAAKLTANLTKDGRLNTLRTRRGFAGRTAKGARHGDTRARILELYGIPKRQYTDAAWWQYPGIGFWFDGNDRVGGIYVRPRQ
jgi:hypothetical protein